MVKAQQSMTRAWQNMALLSAEVLDSCKKVENQLVSFAAVGVSMDEEAVQEATATCLAADKIIQVEPLGLSCVLISVTHTQQTQRPTAAHFAEQSSTVFPYNQSEK